MQEAIPEQKEGSKRTTKHWQFYLGLALIVLSSIGILYFVLITAMERFPDETLSSAKNWIFIGSHMLLGTIGLFFLSLKK